MKGRISKKWGAAQQVHCSEKQKHMQTDENHNTGKLFQMRLTMELFRMFETLWEARNKDFHKNTLGQNDKSLKEQRVRKRVHSLCNKSCYLATADKKLFPKNMNDILSKRPQQIEKWTTDAGKVMQTAFEEEERTDNHPITNHFNIVSTPGPPN